MELNNNRCRNTVFLILVVLVGLTLLGCEHGVWYKPVNWTEISNLQWKKSVGPAELKFNTMGGHYGTEATVIEMHITNHSDVSSIWIKDAVLKTGRGNYHARVSYKGSEMIPLAPGETRKGTLFWDFKEQLAKILIEPIEVDITLQIGTEEVVFKIPMVHAQ